MKQKIVKSTYYACCAWLIVFSGLAIGALCSAAIALIWRAEDISILLFQIFGTIAVLLVPLFYAALNLERILPPTQTDKG